MATPVHLFKRTLIQSGFEIYRTLGDCIQLAERVRDNLIMDSAVVACLGEQPAVRVTLRAQRSEFPGESTEQLWAKARELAHPAFAAGYVEHSSEVVAIPDPVDDTHTIDTWHQVTLQKRVPDEQSLVEELRFALRLERVAQNRADQ